MGRDADSQRRTPRGLRPAGFTLVELLVVIAIIGILVALLLPAVQAARGAARRTKCLNNLKNLALGLHNYHDAHRSFPPAMQLANVDSSASRNDNASNMNDLMPNWAILVLPYIEEQSLYDLFESGTEADPIYLNNPLNQQARSTPVEVFTCPSDSGHETHYSNSTAGEDWARGNYGLNAFQFFPPYFNDPVDGWNSRTPRRGMGGVNQTMKISQVTDGTSSTILLGELRVGLGSIDSRGTWALGRCGANIHCRHASNLITSPNSCSDGDDDVFQGPLIRQAYGDSVLRERCMVPERSAGSNQTVVRSPHPGGVHVAMVDGSSRLISDYIDGGEPVVNSDYDAAFPSKFGVWQFLNLSQDEQVIDELP